jgi:hypothetical protein
MSTCANCGVAMQGRYCHACGQEAAQPIDFGLVARVISRETIELDGRFARTLIDLTVRPGRAIAEYLAGHRIALYNPAKYLFLLTTVAIVLVSLLDLQLVNEAQQAALDRNPNAARGVELLIALSAYMNFLVALLAAVPQALLSRIGPVRRKLAESFVVQMFVQGHITIPATILAVMFPAYAYLASSAASVMLIPYLAWVLTDVHGVSWSRSIVQSMAVFVTYAFFSVLLFAMAQLFGMFWLTGT